VPFCATNLSGKLISVHLHFEGAPIPDQFFVELYEDPPHSGIALVNLAAGTKDTIVQGVAANAASTRLVLWFNTLSTGNGVPVAWKGTIDVDDLQIN
jgi:hypothetical protein